MTQTPTDALRLEAAKIIDPAAFLFKADELMKGDTLQYDALRKAERILALAAPASPLPGGGEAEFEIIQNEDHAASVSGPRDRAYAEAKHYAAIYGQDGPVEVFEVIRRPVPELSSADPTGDA